jgi:hypothetical protein
MAYKHHKYSSDPVLMMPFACFECRKSFKRKLTWSRKTTNAQACPQCRKEMCEMGRQFKAPAQTDTKQWRKVEALVRGGITFHSKLLHRLRNMPKVVREVAPFVRRVRRDEMSDGQLLLDDIPRKRRKRMAA